MENVLFVVAISVVIAVGIYAAILLYRIGQEEKSFKRKTQMEIGKSVNDRFEEIERSLQRIEAKLGNVQKDAHRACCNLGEYRKEVAEHFNYDNNMYNHNLDVITKDMEEIFKLLKPEEEKKENDNSPIWGILSGILSGALTSVLMNTKSENKEETQSQSEETSNAIYGIRNKATGEVLEQRFNSALDAYRGLKENNLNFDDYEIGIIKNEENKPEETQE